MKNNIIIFTLITLLIGTNVALPILGDNSENTNYSIASKSDHSTLNIENGKPDKIRDILEELIDKFAIIDDKKTNPGYVILEEQPPFEIYKKSVQEIVSLEETEK